MPQLLVVQDSFYWLCKRGSSFAPFSCRLKIIVVINRGQPILTASFPPQKKIWFFLEKNRKKNFRGGKGAIEVGCPPSAP
jgi:hypothetical protein